MLFPLVSRSPLHSREPGVMGGPGDALSGVYEEGTGPGGHAAQHDHEPRGAIA